jgi:NAD(P)-dependent dehydrogenase (short-subunit alcohol dehydrogenase family)
MLCDVGAADGRKLALELGTRAGFAAADVTDEAQVAAAIAEARAKFGALHGAANCAGVAPGERILGKGGAHRLDSFRRAVEINLVGTFNVLRLAAAAMSQNEPLRFGERGVIINTASIAAYDGQIGQVAYAASKGGVVGMTLPAARDLSKAGIRVLAIAPGTFDTPMLALLPEEARQALAAGIPFPSKLGHPDEFAMLAQHMVENPYLNGETVRLDGALRMPPK